LFLSESRSSSVIPTLSLHDALPISVHLGICYVFKAKFGIIGLTDNHKSRRFQGLGKVAGLGGNLVGKEAVGVGRRQAGFGLPQPDRKSTRLNSSHVSISYAVFCLKK